MGACQGCDEWQTILVSAYRIGNFPCGACASPAPPGLKGTCLTASLLPRTNHALQKTAWECPEGCVPVPTQHQPQQQPPQQPQQNQHQQYYNAWGQAQQPNHWQQPAWGQNMFGQQPAWGQHGAQLHQRQGFGGVQQNTGQTASGQHPGWGGYQQQGAQHGGPHHGAHGGQPPQHGAQAPATRAGTAPTANAFAWKAPKNKPEPLSKESTFEWDDGRRDHDFPPLGAGDGQSSGCNTPSYSRFGESKPNSPYQATPYSNYSSNGGYLGRSQAHHHQANQAPPTDKWPPKLQTFVEKAFKQCNTAHERTCMQETLKMIIQNATKNNLMWSTDWDAQPLPRVASAPASAQNHAGQDAERKAKNKKGYEKKQRRKLKGEEDPMYLEADMQAREKRHKRFIDMERGYSAVGSGANQADGDGEMKFMSSEAIVGTCMEMEKMYIRLQSMPDPASVRPERVLVKWAERLQVKYDTDEADWEWISDQFKAIRQDMVIQHIRTANAVKVYETNGRLALQEQDYPEFYKIQSFLMGLYKDNADASENEPEFMAYRLFYWMLNNNTVDMTKDIRNMSQSTKKHPEIVHAVALHQALELSDYVSFFRLYADTPNMGKCVVDTLRDRLRSRALRVLLRSYKPSIPVDFLQAQLGFRETGGIDEMLNSSLGVAPDEDDDDNWVKFADHYCLLSIPEVCTLCLCRHTLVSLSTQVSKTPSDVYKNARS
jgi:hypothetical protein